LFEHLLQLTQLSAWEFAIAAGAVFAASLVRGFAGFGLSALIMASLVTIIPPVALIPVCYVLEGAASVIMLRGGWKDADMSVVWGLVIGSVIGLPIGLLATTSIDVDLSKLLALLVILALTLAQFMRFRPRFLATRKGLYASGLTAGVASGLASVGGMVVALFVLARDADAKTMRASLVMYLFIGLFTSLGYLLAYGLMTEQALYRGLVFAPLVLLGVFCGTLFFRPSLVHLYKRVCLLLLMLLCLIGLARRLF
jgi:uncharacterized membrane protein YfcA